MKLPESLRVDEKIKAATKYFDEELAKLSGEIKRVLHLPRLEELPSNVLDYLAWQYHVDNYAADYANEIKREMIRESIYLHRIKGTPAAVMLALKAFSKNAEIKEWWEYGGKAYGFRVILHDLADVGDDGEALLRSVNDAKNVRSWLEEVTVDFSLGEVESELKQGAVEMSGGEILTEMPFGELFSEEFCQGVAEVVGGEIIIEVDRAEASESAEKFAGILEEVGGEEVVESAGESELPQEEEVFEANSLRLYFGFPNNAIRLLTMENPRANILPTEINLLGRFSAERKLLLNSKGLVTDGIRRAVLVTKNIEVIL